MPRKTDKTLKERISYLENALRLKDEEYKKFFETIIDNISHELRTPLNAINGFSGLIQSRELPFKKVEDYFEIIHANIARIQFVIDNVIELSFLNANKLEMKKEVCNLSEILKSTFYYANHLKMKYKKNAVAIICGDIESELVEEFIADEYRIMLVLRNLINNALKNTTKGYVEFGCSSDNDLLKFFVMDTGKGYDKNIISDAFQNQKKQSVG